MYDILLMTTVSMDMLQWLFYIKYTLSLELSLLELLFRFDYVASCPLLTKKKQSLSEVIISGKDQVERQY